MHQLIFCALGPSSLSEVTKSLAPTGFSSEIGTKLRDWAVGQAGGSCYSWAALPSNDSKTRYDTAPRLDSGNLNF